MMSVMLIVTTHMATAFKVREIVPLDEVVCVCTLRQNLYFESVGQKKRR